MKHRKIRKCTVELNRLGVKNLTFQKALFRIYGIRDWRLHLNRLIPEAVTPTTPKLKLLPDPNVKSVRFMVPWLPKTFNLKCTTLANMETGQRSLSMVNERTKPTTEEYHSELMKKLESPNRCLRSVDPVDHRLNPAPTSEPVPEWKKIFQEFQQRKTECELKNAEKSFSSVLI